MSKKVKVDGKVYIVPDDATPDEIDEISGGKPAAAPVQAAPAKQPGMLDGINSSLNFSPNDSGIATALKTGGQAIMGPMNEAADTIKGIGGIPRLVSADKDAPIGERMIGAASPVALGAYRMGKGLLGQAKDSVIAGYNAHKQGEGLPGVALAAAEKAPLIGDLTDKMEHGGGVGAVTQGMTRAALLKAPEAARGMRDFAGQQIIKGTPEQLIMRATKPTIGLPEYEQSVKTALPELAKHNPKSLNELSVAADKLKTAKNAEFNQLRDRVPAVDTSRAADLQDKSLPARYRIEDTTGARQRSLENKGIPYRRTLPMPDVDAVRIGTNAELRDFFNKTGGDQQAALQNPETSRIHALNTGLRDSQYDAIKGVTGVDPRPIQEMYGHAVDIGDTAARRNTVFSRQQPIPLVKQIAAASGNPAGFALSNIVSGLNDSDRLVKYGIGRYNRSLTPPDGRLRLMIGGPMINSSDRNRQ